MPESDPSVPRYQYPEWQEDYQAAFLELDREKLLERVAVAKAAISERLQRITQERQAIDNALAALRVLKQQKLDYR